MEWISNRNPDSIIAGRYPVMSPSCAAASCERIVTEISNPCPSAGTRKAADTRPRVSSEPRNGRWNSTRAVTTHTAIEIIASTK